jgi:NADPH-dependent 2,4-dienoyl-CoA reductase/sulfur reductase-like enzyme
MLKVIIVGGVAGGASCAARLRCLDENDESGEKRLKNDVGGDHEHTP